MTWQDRIKDAVYTAPSGRSFTFLYEDISKDTDLKTSTFVFSGKSGAYIQSHGRAGRRFPFTCIFSGEDCMDEADAFEDALAEKGYGELQHPVYGVFKVVPTGTIKRRDNLVTGLNESIVETEFSETITDVDLPESEVAVDSVIQENLDTFEEVSAQEFADNFFFETAGEAIQGQNVVNAQVYLTSQSLVEIAKQEPSAYSKFQTILKSLENTIDNIFLEKLNAGRQILNLLKTPSRILVSAMVKIDGYQQLINQLIGQYSRDPVGVNNMRNQFASTRLNLFGALADLASGIALASLSSSRGRPAVFSSREEAILAAETLELLLEQAKEFQDSKISKDIFVDTDGGYSELLSIVYGSVQIIINASFSLPTRKIIVLDRDRQLIELTAELYGDLDKIDDVILQNNLNADEIEILSMGTEITYYV